MSIFRRFGKKSSSNLAKHASDMVTEERDIVEAEVCHVEGKEAILKLPYKKMSTGGGVYFRTRLPKNIAVAVGDMLLCDVEIYKYKATGELYRVKNCSVNYHRP